MRVLHLVSYAVYSGPVPGVVGLAQAQRALGHEVHVAHDSRRGPFSPYEEALSAKGHLGGGTLVPPYALAVSPKAGPLTFAADLLRLRGLLRRGEIDVVHAHLSHDHWLAAAASARLPTVRVRTVHAERVLRPRFSGRLLWRACDGVVVRTAAHGEALAPAGLAADVPRAVVPGGIDGDFWRPSARGDAAAGAARQATREALGLPADAQVLLHVALMADRGQAELIEAVRLQAAQAPQLHLVLVGLGPQREALVAQVAAAGLQRRVHFAGYLAAPSLRALYGASDAAFVAQAGNDAATRAVLEAMASELAVVAVRQGACAALVDEVVGYPVASRAPPAVAAGLAAWLADRERGRARGRAARRRVLRQRTFAQEAEATLALYQAAAQRRGRRPRR